MCIRDRVHAGQAADDGPVADVDVAAQLHRVGQDGVAADMAIMRHVHVGLSLIHI